VRPSPFIGCRRGQITSRSFAGPLACSNTLATLLLDGTSINDAALATLATARCTALRVLSCRNTQLTVGCLRHLPTFASKLRLLDLTGARAIANASVMAEIDAWYAWRRYRIVWRAMVPHAEWREGNAMGGGRSVMQIATTGMQPERLLLPSLGLGEAALTALINHCGARLAVLDVSNTAGVTDPVLAAVASFCPNLTR